MPASVAKQFFPFMRGIGRTLPTTAKQAYVYNSGTGLFELAQVGRLDSANTWTQSQTINGTGAKLILDDNAGGGTSFGEIYWSNASARLTFSTGDTGVFGAEFLCDLIMSRNAPTLTIGGNDATLAQIFWLRGFGSGNAGIACPADNTLRITNGGTGFGFLRYASSSSWGLSSTSTARQRTNDDVQVVDNTDATRKYRIVKSVYDTAAREYMQAEANGSAAMVGFLGASAVLRQTIGAAATDAATTQTLANNIRTALINLGLCST